MKHQPSKEIGSMEKSSYVLLISGPSRIGKSRISQSLALRINARLAHTDPMRADILKSRNPAFSRILKYTQIINSAQEHGVNLILEGMDLTRDLRRKERNLDTMLFFRDEMGCRLAVLGPGPDESVASISDSIFESSMRNRDWIYKRYSSNPEEMRRNTDRLARDGVLLGEKFRNLCEANNVRYYEANRAFYDDAIGVIEKAIYEDLLM